MLFRSNEQLPVVDVVMRLSERDGGTRMELRSTYASREELDKLVGMGMLDGLEQAVGQMDAILASGTRSS